MSELPMGWVAIPLQEFGMWGSGGTPPKGNTAYYQGDIPWAVIGDLNDGLLTTTANHIADSGLANSSAKLVPPGTLLIAMYGSIGKLAIAGIECCTNQAIAFCRVDESVADTGYLFHLLRCVRPELIKLGQGASQQNISQTILKAFEVPLAPRAEQTRIAQKLDELLTQIDTLKARIDGIPTLLKRFRQSVLTAAVSGRLTDEWRDERQLPSICEVELGALIKSGPQNGLYKPSSAYGEGSKIIRIDSFYSGEIKAWDTLRSLKIEPKELDAWGVKIGDILINRVNSIEYLGKCAVVRTVPEPTVFESNIMRMSLHTDRIHPEYLMRYLTSEVGRKALIVKAKHAVNQASINQGDVKACKVPLPSLEEQTEIVRRVEQLFAFADQLETKVTSAKSRIDHLTQSILAKAFRGELVPQDPNDEPAIVLLERIQAQRAAAPKAKRGRKASA